VRTIHGHTIDSGSGQCGSRLQRLKLALARNETLQAARLNSLVLLLRKLSQPIRNDSQILTQHCAAGDHFVLDRLLDQLVLTDAQSGGDLSSQNPKLLVTPTQWKYSSWGHASSMSFG
jgi:hypothetical protein